jgi:integrase
MGRTRKKNKGLPERVYIDYGKQRKDGSWPKPIFYLKKDDNTRLFLGNTEAQMWRKWVELIERPNRIMSMEDLINQYLKEVSAKKGSYDNEVIKANFLKAYFKELAPDEVTAPHIYEYMDIRSQKEKIKKEVNGRIVVIVKGGQVAANREKSMLSSIFSFAIRKGIVKVNPCTDVERFEEKARDRYPEDWELQAVYNESSNILKCIIDFEYLAGQRIGDAIAIMESDITQEGIRIIQDKSLHHKQKVKLLIEWSDALRDCVNRARKLRGSMRSMYLFCKKDGQPYTYAGIRSMFERAMNKALEKGTLKEKFHIHDIRAKTYSDDEDQEQKIKRAGHIDAKMGRVYDRKFKKVKPLK